MQHGVWGLSVAATLAMAAATGGLSAAIPFRAPSDDGGPFRRDRLPLDVDMMSSLADGLVAMASHAGQAGTPEGHRAAAQLLALADTLDPARGDAAELLATLSKGSKPAPPAPPALAAAGQGAWKLHEWLAAADGGSDSSRFAACLGDALAAADPGHPRAAKLREAGEQGKWTGWVADLAAFRPSESAPASPGGATSQDPPDRPPPPVVPGAAVAIKLPSASVQVPLHRYDPKQQKSVFGVFPLTLKAWSEEPSGESSEHADGAKGEAKQHGGDEQPQTRSPAYTLVTGQEDGGEGQLYGTMQAIRQQLTQRHGGLPPAGRARVTVGPLGGYDWSRNRDSGAAALALLLDASLSGTAPADKVIVLAGFASDGTLTVPWHAWESLRMLAEDPDIPGGRLVLPKAALAMLDGLLVMERPEFFLRYEVLLAGDLGELVERAGVAPGAAQAAASVVYGEVRSAAAGKQVGPYLANRFVRQRLAELVAAFPDHGSARLLLKQGGGERPVTFESTILARELRHALRPMEWVPKAKSEDLTDEGLGTAFSACRERIDALEDRVARNDQELYAAGFEVVQRVRTLSNALARAQKGRRQGEWDGAGDRAVQKEHQALGNDYGALLDRILKLIGEAEPAPAGATGGGGHGDGGKGAPAPAQPAQ